MQLLCSTLTFPQLNSQVAQERFIYHLLPGFSNLEILSFPQNVLQEELSSLV